MGVVHFLNVGAGDCSIIEHNSKRISVIDICNGNYEKTDLEMLRESMYGNFNQKAHPVNPVSYLKKIGIESIFRFILTHPDMDHLDGLKNLYKLFKVHNFWDTDNKREKPSFNGGLYHECDWDTYQKVRKNALFLYDGLRGPYYNCDDEYRTGNGDCLQILCPTKELIDDANDDGNYNNSSYVILYNEAGKKILFSGDAEKKEWDYLLKKHEDILTNIDVLIAPHHGRKSGGNDDFLDVLKPKLTLFGNAKSKDLNYNDWLNRGLKHYTNNQGGTFVLENSREHIYLYCTHKTFAEKVAKQEGVPLQCNRHYDAWLMDII